MLGGITTSPVVLSPAQTVPLSLALFKRASRYLITILNQISNIQDGVLGCSSTSQEKVAALRKALTHSPRVLITIMFLSILPGDFSRLVFKTHPESAHSPVQAMPQPTVPTVGNDKKPITPALGPLLTRDKL